MASSKHNKLVQTLSNIGQDHLFAFYDKLPPQRQEQFDAQLASLDWDLIDKLIQTVVKSPERFDLTGKTIVPAPYYPHTPTDPALKEKFRQAYARGEELLRNGQVAAFVVAGGQGTRLGWDAPKGTFPATAIKNKPLFACFAEFLLEIGRRYGKPVPFYVMTSQLNDRPTREFWQKNHFFGLNPADVWFFAQDMLPAVSFDGKVLLESEDSLALSPNGHGGSLLALHKSGALADMARRGVTQISYFQVDNPIVRCIDPLFLGLHDMDGAEMSSKMLPKNGPREKVGNFVLMDGVMSVIEYSDMPDALAEQKGADGQLKYRAGSIALHALRRDFVEELNREGFGLPFHRAEKKVPYLDVASGQAVKPEKPNAAKMETFVFDALPLTKTSIIYETERLDDFAPIKQPEGADSVVSSRELTTERNARWLEAAGIAVPRDKEGKVEAVIEIAPSFALYPADVAAKKQQVPAIAAGSRVYLS